MTNRPCWRRSASAAWRFSQSMLPAIDRRAIKASQVSRPFHRPSLDRSSEPSWSLKAVPSPKVALVVVAAGRGARLGAERPKQYLICAGKPLLAHTLEALTGAWPFSAVVVAIRGEDRDLYHEALAHLTPEAASAIGEPAIGGATRQQSVLAGLEALAAAKPDI